MTRPLAIWDVDGTLIDSRFMINAAMERAFALCKLTPPTYEQTRKIVGLSLDVAIDRLAPRDIDERGLAALVEAYKTEFVALRNSNKELEPLYAGMADILVDLKTAGWALGIATGKSRRGLEAVMTRLVWGDLFDANYCASDGPGKPHPFMVQANLVETDTLPQHAVVIGDTSFDMAMAKGAGCSAFGVNWGFHTEDEIREGGADYIFTSPSDLSAALFDFAKAKAA